MADHDHKPPDPYPEEGGPCWCGSDEAKLELIPNGGICNCGAPGALPPCWNCENSVFRCAKCYAEIDEIDWPVIALGHPKLSG